MDYRKVREELIKADEQEEIFRTAPADFFFTSLPEDADEVAEYELLVNGMMDDESETARKGYDDPIAAECNNQDIQDCADHLGALVVVS